MGQILSPGKIDTWSINRFRPFSCNSKINDTVLIAKIAASILKIG